MLVFPLECRGESGCVGGCVCVCYLNEHFYILCMILPLLIFSVCCRVQTCPSRLVTKKFFREKTILARYTTFCYLNLILLWTLYCVTRVRVLIVVRLLLVLRHSGHVIYSGNGGMPLNRLLGTARSISIIICSKSTGRCGSASIASTSSLPLPKVRDRAVSVQPTYKQMATTRAQIRVS